MRRRVIAARAQLFGSALCFGLMAALARLGSRDAGGFTAAQLATVRFAIGTGLMLVVFRVRPGTFRPVRYPLLVTRAVLGALAALLYFVALSRIPAGAATLLNNTFPVFATVLSIWTIGERPTLHLAIALAVVSAGVFLVVGPGSSSLAFGWGELAGIVSALVGAGAVTSIRVLRASNVNAFTIFFFFCLGGLAVSAPFAGGAWPAGLVAWAIAAAVGVLSFFAQLLMTQAYGALTVPEAALWQQLTPLASYAWALGILDERLSPLALVGVVVGGLGVAYGTVLGHRPPAPAPARPEPARMDAA